MDYRTFRNGKNRKFIKGRRRTGRKMRQLDPRVSIVNGRKTGNVSGREPIGGPWGAVKARRIYGVDTAQRPCMRRKMTRHMN